MFSSFSLRTKLITICSALAMFSVVSGGIGYFAMRNVEHKYGVVAENNLPSVTQVARMYLEFRATRIAVRTLGLEGITEPQKEEAIRQAEAAIAAYEEEDRKYQAIPFLEGEREHYDAIAREWAAFKPVGAEIIRLARSRDPASRTRLREIMFKDCPESAQRFGRAMESMLEFQQKTAKSWTASAESTASAANWMFGVVIFLSFGIAQLLGMLFANALAKSLTAISERLSEGADQVASASIQISSSGAELSAAATEQASALQETVASVDEVSAMVGKNAENARKSLDAASSSKISASRGKEAVDDMIHSIEEINSSNADIMRQIEQSNREISEIVNVITEIGNRTKVINDIVFQTKLLSFNASVEAARAGEHGKGFAVVAEEVGNLAQMSGNAAKEIGAMLEGSTRKVQQIVSDTRQRVEQLVSLGKAKVEAGTQTAKRCGEVLDEIVGKVEQMNQMVSEISSASQEQSQGVQEINRAMSQLDQVTQQNASAAQQSAGASESLTGQADALRQVVLTLLATIQGGGATAAAVQAAPARRSQGGSQGKVVHLKRAPVRSLKKAAGAETIPLADDPRFEDV